MTPIERLTTVMDRLDIWADNEGWLAVRLPDSEAEPHWNAAKNYAALSKEIEAAINQLKPPASDRPGDAAAEMHDETGIPYDQCLVMCNMD